jgi:hypothetical protein
LKRKVTLQGPSVVATKGARAAIEKAGGRIEEARRPEGRQPNMATAAGNAALAIR